MSPKEQLAAAALAALPLLYALLRLALTAVQLKQVELDAAKAARLASVATGAAHYAEEVYATAKKQGATGVDRAKLAGDIVADKFPALDDDEVAIAVTTAVGAAPTLGNSAKPLNGTSKPALVPPRQDDQ